MFRIGASNLHAFSRTGLSISTKSFLSTQVNQSFISNTQKEFLKENGYLVLRNFLPVQKCQALEKRIGKLIAEFDPTTSTSLFRGHRTDKEYEDQYFLTSGNQIRFFWEPDAFNDKGELQFPIADSINKVGHALHTKDDLFRDYVFNDLRPAVEGVGYKKPVPLQAMYICKSQRTGGEVGPHQDSTFLYTNPTSVHAFWLSIHSSSQENGCLWAIPGSQKYPLYQRFVRVPAPDNPNKTVLRMIQHEMPENESLPTKGGVPIETDVGDLVILHGQIVHWSNANRSDQSRHAFMMHVIEGENDYPKDNWLQYPENEKFPTFA